MDPLERELRAANPLRSHRSDPLSERAQLDLAEILASAPAADADPDADATSPEHAPRPARSRRTRLGWALAAVAVLATTAVVTVTALGVNPPASVASPPLLEVTPIDASLDEVLAELIGKARPLPGDTSPVQTIRYEEWAAQIEVDEEQTTFFVQPFEVTRSRQADLSGFFETRAGVVRWGDPTDPEGVPEPGELLERYDYGPGEFPILFPAPPPETGEELAAQMQSTLHYAPGIDTGAYFFDLQNLRSEWPLTGPQAVAVLELVGLLPDVELLGRVTDRLGRPGIAVQTETMHDGAFRNILVFNPETGVLQSTEMVYLGGHSDVDLPVDTVTSYSAWRESE